MLVLLVGPPVGHSHSPLMQTAAFAAAALEHRYELADTPAEDLLERISSLRGATFLGANVTVPHKLAVLPLVDELDDEARALGALNTVVVRGGRLHGFNTDIAGAREGLLLPVRDALAGATVVLMGAGGGARAVVMARARLPGPGPAEVLVAARRAGTAAPVVELARGLGLHSRDLPWVDSRAGLGGATVVVNCTPLGLAGEDPLEGISLGGLVVLDLAYRQGGTPLFRRAREEAVAALQGDEMLLHQGAAAFRLWTGAAAPLEAMRSALQRGIG
ncbi:MAG: shikimate dehydrogenase [Candidatus Dormibacteria bacterium]